VVSVRGCGGAVSDARWMTTSRGYNSVAFELVLNTTGTAVVTVHADAARAAQGFQNTLDGSQDPAGSDGVGPNGDDYTWTVRCAPGNGPRLPVTSLFPTVTTILPLPTTAPPTTASGGGAAGSGSGSGGSGGGGGGGSTGAGNGSGSPSTGQASSSAPTCSVSAVINLPAPARQFATVRASAGLASISGVSVNNGVVSVPAFTVGTRAAVTLKATKTNQSAPTEWSFYATDVRGQTTFCH
jgi:hypothetical protein